MSVRARKIFKSAVAYTKSASLLNESAVEFEEVFVPSQVNAALALELYFKALYHLIYDTDFKVRDRYSHDFYKIYKALPDDCRERINQHFDSLLASRDKADLKALMKKSNKNISLELESLIQNWSSVFTDIRYIYEDRKGTYIMVLFPEIAQSVMKEIYRIDSNILP